MEKSIKALLIATGVTIIFLGSVQIYFSFFLDSQVRQIVEERFQTATNNKYNLEIEDFDFTILGRELGVSNVRLTTKKDTNRSDIDASVKNFRISGIQYRKLLFEKKLVFNDIEVVNPRIDYTSSGSSTGKKFKWPNVAQKLSDITLQITNKLRIPELKIRGLSVKYNRKNATKSSVFSFNDSNITLMGISVDSSSLDDKRVLPSKNIVTNFKDVQFNTSDGRYKLKADNIAFSSRKNAIELQSLTFKPRLTKKEFAERSEYEYNRMNLNLDHIRLKGVNTKRLNRAGGFEADKISLLAPHFSIYRDKTPPFPPNRSPSLPQQMLHGIPFPVIVDSVSIKDGKIKYSQQKPQSDDIGYISFSNLSADFLNLTNVAEELEKKGPPTLKTQADVMGKGRLNVSFTFPMHNLTQHIKGHLSPMDMKPLNEALIPMAFVKIDDGKILDLKFDMTLNKERASGSVKLLYRDLKVSLLKKKTKDENFGKKMMSFFANTVKIKSKNEGKDPRIGEVKFKRIKRKSTFNYWWKSLLSGLKPSVGL